MTDLVTWNDVETALLRSLTDAEEQFIPGLCAQASAKLRTAMRSVDSRMAAYAADPMDPAGIDPDVVSSMLAGVIKRVLTNPNGVWSKSQSTGPYSTSETYAATRGGSGSSDAPGGLVITPSDLAQLTLVNTGVIPGTMFTRPTRWVSG